MHVKYQSFWRSEGIAHKQGATKWSQNLYTWFGKSISFLEGRVGGRTDRIRILPRPHISRYMCSIALKLPLVPISKCATCFMMQMQTPRLRLFFIWYVWVGMHRKKKQEQMIFSKPFGKKHLTKNVKCTYRFEHSNWFGVFLDLLFYL